MELARLERRLNLGVDIGGSAHRPSVAEPFRRLVDRSKESAAALGIGEVHRVDGAQGLDDGNRPAPGAEVPSRHLGTAYLLQVVVDVVGAHVENLAVLPVGEQLVPAHVLTGMYRAYQFGNGHLGLLIYARLPLELEDE